MSANGKNLAFPLDAGTKRHFGLSKRELIAAMAMQGLLSNPAASMTTDEGSTWSQKVSVWGVEVADALLAELAKEPQA